MPRFVLVSDVHLADVETPPGDVLVAAGDMTMKGTQEQMEWLERWFQRQPQARKIYVPGNHDWEAFHSRRVIRQDVVKSARWLVDEEIHTVGNVRIYGSPWTLCPFSGKGWGYPLFVQSQAEEKWAEIPEGLDILITHGPPFGISDEHWITKQKLGDPWLRRRLQTMKQPPKVHVFGHIHSGTKITEADTTHDGILYLNAAVCDESYNPSNQILILDYEPGSPPVVNAYSQG